MRLFFGMVAVLLVGMVLAIHFFGASEICFPCDDTGSSVERPGPLLP